MTVKVTCETCGDVDLPDITHVTLRVHNVTGEATFSFRCPVCGARDSRPCQRLIVNLLVSGGAPLRVWGWPAELGERHDGPAITHDDLLAFHEQLDQLRGSVA